jgi:hypothetical protein
MTDIQRELISIIVNSDDPYKMIELAYDLIYAAKNRASFLSPTADHCSAIQLSTQR